MTARTGGLLGARAPAGANSVFDRSGQLSVDASEIHRYSHRMSQLLLDLDGPPNEQEETTVSPDPRSSREPLWNMDEGWPTLRQSKIVPVDEKVVEAAAEEQGENLHELWLNRGHEHHHPDLYRIAAAKHVADELRKVADKVERTFVFKARQSGQSWADIGEALGMSKQAAQQKYGTI